MYILETDRLILQPFKAEDVGFLDYLHSDMDVMRYTIGRTRSHSENIAYIKMMQQLYEQRRGHMLVLKKSDKSPIGRCGYCNFLCVNDWEMDWFYFGAPDIVTKEGDIFEHLELGYSFAKKYWGQGYATEAASAQKAFGYKELGLDGFSSLVVKQNKGSIGVAEKLGVAEIRDCMVFDVPSYDFRNKKDE